MRQTLLRIPPAPRTVLVSDRLHLNVLKLRLGVGNADRGDIGLAGLWLHRRAPRSVSTRLAEYRWRSTMSRWLSGRREQTATSRRPRRRSHGSRSTGQRSHGSTSTAGGRAAQGLGVLA